MARKLTVLVLLSHLALLVLVYQVVRNVTLRGSSDLMAAEPFLLLAAAGLVYANIHVIVRHVSRPLEDLTGSVIEATKSREGSYEAARQHHDDELGRLVVAFNQLLEERSRREKELRLAHQRVEAAMAVQSDFLAEMGQEIRDPMSGLLGLLKLALRTDLTPSQKRYLTTAHSAAESLFTMVNDVFDLTRMEFGEYDFHEDIVNLNQLLDESLGMVSMAAREKGIELVGHFDEAVPTWVVLDPIRVRQVLLKLVNNAINFTDEGTIEVKVGLLEQNGAEVVLQFEVRDTGVGLSPTQQAEILEPREEVPGHPKEEKGFGLSTCQRLVGGMGGQLSVESEAGRGSAFRFTVKAVTSEPPSTMALPPLPHLKVLMGEHDLVSQEVARTLFGDFWNMDLTVVSRGGRVLEAVETGHYDLILIDLQIPGQDAFEVVRAIRSQDGVGRHIPIIALTSHPLTSDRERCLEEGIDKYLPKPLEEVELHRTLLGLLHLEESVSQELSG